MKKGFILVVMLVGILALAFGQATFSGTYRYSTNAAITFTGNDFNGNWNATTPISGTYTVSGDRLTLIITGGPNAQNTWNWTIVDTQTLRDQDGDRWIRETVQVPISWNVNNASTYVEAINGIRSSGNNRTHILIVTGNISIPIGVEGMFGSVTGITITIQGSNNVVSLSGNGTMFHIGSRQTVIIKDITLQGREANNLSLVIITNGGTLRMEGTAILKGNTLINGNGGGVSVMDGGNFIMQDNTLVSGNTVTEGHGGGVYISNKGTFIMYNGRISDNISAGMDNGGGGVYIGGNGNFTMQNGTISGNTARGHSNSWAPMGVEVYGGGVYITDGTFTMQGGTIQNNTVHAIKGGGYSSNAPYGGGVYINGGTFIMQGNATVSGNTTTAEENYSKRGGGVYVNNGTFTMRDNTSVSGNIATDGSGGGIIINSNGTFTMQNNASISGNTASWGGGLYVNTNRTITMQGGTVSGNTASWGGGIYISTNRTFIMRDGTLSGNIAQCGGGGVFVNDNGTFTMQGGILSSNTARQEGGGVYINGESEGGTFTKTGGILYGSNAEDGLKNTSSNFGNAVFNKKTNNWRDSTAGASMSSDSFGFWLNEQEVAEFPLSFLGTWKRDSFDNTLTFTIDTLKSSTQNYTWNLMRVSSDSYTVNINATTIPIYMKLISGTLEISGDSGTGENNWNGTWKKQR